MITIHRSVAFLAAGLVSAVGLTTVAPSATAACGISEGTPSNVRAQGTKVGSNPVRFEFADSPYLGVQYDSCRNVVNVFYGGYNGITHYNIRYDSPTSNPLGGPDKQIEVAPGAARRWTLSAAPYQGPRSWRRIDFMVQACKRGSGLFASSKCTRWSPLVGVPAGPPGG